MICQAVAHTAGKSVTFAQGTLRRELRRSENMVRNATEDDKHEMSHRKAMEEAVDDRAFMEGMI